LLAPLCAAFLLGWIAPLAAQSTTLGGTTFTLKGLVGVGRVAAATRDKQGETFGSLSGLALDVRTLRRNTDGSFTATLYAQPDRGYVKSSVTTNYRPRRQRFTLTFKPDTNGSSKQDQIDLSLAETILYAESNATPLTSLDPTVTGAAVRGGFPRLPQAFNNRLALDAEGIALLPDGTFFVSDEYGPYLYRFSADGVLLGAVRPPEAFIPKRGGQDSFSSDSPAAGQPSALPSGPDSGRENSQGLEGLSLSANGRSLFAVMQSALRQDGGSGGNSTRRHARLLEYDISTPAAPVLVRECVLPLPTYTVNGAQLVASVGDIATLGSRFLLVLVRDGNGRGADVAKSNYRAVLVYDLASATNLAGSAFDSATTPAAPGGVLASTIVPATSTVLIDLNNATELAKFNLNNNTNDNSDTLAEKWESLALLPALDATTPDDFFLLVGNDNDFSTTDGLQDGAAYRAGTSIDTMVLAYRLTLPGTTYLPNILAQPASRSVALASSVTFTASALGNPAPTFQWRKDGANISGATTATLTIPNALVADAAAYTVVVTNTVGSVTSASATLSIIGATTPVFTLQPVSQTVAPGATVVFSAGATNSPSYQWLRNGVVIDGATNSLLIFTNATAANAATYTAVASRGAENIPSSSATLTVATATAPADVGRLINLSILTAITTTDSQFALGTVLGGAGTSGTKPLLVRAAGPSLAPFGIASPLANPKLDLLDGQTVFATNDDWGGTATLSAAFTRVGAFAYLNAASRDAAVFSATTPARGYSVQVSGVGGTTGAVIAELYDATEAGTFTAATPRLINVSVIKFIPAGSLLSAGFVIGGTTSKTVLIRVIGPRLTAFGIADQMLDPKLDLFEGTTVIASNDNWGGDAQLTTVGNSVGAFTVIDAASRDAMLLITLPPRGYSVQASGVNNTGGRALVEVYEVP
jgi:hypothetical protein